MTRIQSEPFLRARTGATDAGPAPRKPRAAKFRLDDRASGILLHPTSLSGTPFSGDLGPAAYAFADWLAAAGQRWWQMLPINPPGAAPGHSPYSSYSAFAGSPWLISLERLVDDGLLKSSDVARPESANGAPMANLDANIRFRLPRLHKAYEAFKAAGGLSDSQFAEFCRANESWLEDDALFSALKDAHRGAPWSNWPMPLRLREPRALKAAREKYADAVDFHRFIQLQFDRQWTALKEYCNDRRIGLIGDIPIFVAHDSSDLWAHRELFLLNRSGKPETVSGYPPDAFNANGQLWGHPHYNWPAHETSGWAWWISRFARTLGQFDAARIDHFLGFHRTWHVPGRSTTARKGEWVLTPGRALFDALRRAMPGSPQIIAEDLGRVTPEAASLRDRYKFPGMRIMQFGFGGDDDQDGGAYHLPHRYLRRCVAYPGTHDNHTFVGWLKLLKATARKSGKTSPAARELAKVQAYLDARSERDAHWSMIRALSMSVANTVVFPAQDILGLDDDYRMNVPGVAEGNWRWRLRTGQLTSAHAKKLRELTQVYGRT